ncbi:MaoC/PaaZ C-terminal domain-containing protein [Streptomyces sp. NPDC093085]|uniref:MaoC/PaaZ C-terminal domain-containing protein n=1 Tax=Streptomyces sp. NPDC093085 TaxID=3155068 RepID=UPI0034271B5E
MSGGVAFDGNTGFLKSKQSVVNTLGDYFEDFSLGERFTSDGVSLEAGDITAFAGLSGDQNPIHTDEEYARRTPLGTRIAHGVLVVSKMTGRFNQLGFWDGSVIAMLENRWAFHRPVHAGRHRARGAAHRLRADKLQVREQRGRGDHLRHPQPASGTGEERPVDPVAQQQAGASRTDLMLSAGGSRQRTISPYCCSSPLR